MSALSASRSLILVPGDRLSAPELQSAALDGEVVALADAFVCVDAPLSALTRAAAVGIHLSDTRVMVSDRSAAWVWGWGPTPASITTSVSISARIPSPDRRRLHVREVVIDDDERVVLGGTAVTSPERTLLDLARHDPDDEIVALLAAAITALGLQLSDLERLLSRRRRLAFVHPARRRLLAALLMATS